MLVYALLVLLLAAPAAHAQLTLESIFIDEAHDGPEIPELAWLPDGSGHLEQSTDEETGETLWTRHDAKTGESSEWLRLACPDETEIASLSISEDGRYALLKTDEIERWRYSASFDHWIVDLKSRELDKLSDAGNELHAFFSPDGSHVGYVRAGNLYVRPTNGGEERALTGDGSDVVFNGEPDWVYEEELGILEGWWWAPDGRSIAYMHVDSEVIGAFPLVTVGDGSYQSVKMIPYPKAGFDNSTVTLRILDVASGRSRDVVTFGPSDGYLARVHWMPDSQTLLYQWTNRDQNRLELRAVPVADPASSQIWIEETSPGWVEVNDDLRILADGRLVWSSERDGFRHLYLRETDGRLRQLTSGRWVVREVGGLVDDESAVLVVTGRDSHLIRQVDRVELADGSIRRVVDEDGWHDVDVSPNGEWFMDNWTTGQTREQSSLRDANGGVVRHIAQDDRADLMALAGIDERFLSFTTEAGVELYMRMLLPEDFDANHKHPVVMYCYGGPQSQRAVQNWASRGREMYHRLLVQDGFVLAIVDGRGTGGRGREFKSTVYRRLGQLEAEDQAAGARYLKSLSFVDPDRIAIWGWSYGAYVGAMSLFKFPEEFAAGIAVSPVSDWRFYDTIYTERYMGLPRENEAGYDAGSLLPFAAELERPFLLIHGTGDENVHPQNTLRLATELQHAGKEFRLMLYPDKDHPIPGAETRLHLYSTMRNFLHEQLSLEPPTRSGK